MKKKQPLLEVFKRKDGDWGWRKVSTNGRVVSVAGEGFKRRGAAILAARREHPSLELALLRG